ncbi:MAG: exosortase/archaeosortase family protein, partial [Candidatus Hodarchaeota archaeon]
MTFKNTIFLSFTILTLVLFYTPLKNLMSLSLHYNELYSHMILIPFVSGYFLYTRRKTIFSDTNYSYISGITLMVIGVVFFLIGKSQGVKLDQNDYLSLMTFSTVTTWIGGFVFFFGMQAAREAAFPLLFLLFLIPIPSVVLEKVILLLQLGSTEASYGIFKLTGVLFVREGPVFHLPGLSVEVAEQCSGIRSSLALFITSIIAGQLFLKTGWKKIVLSLSIFPITIFKNGLRVVTLSLLGVYVD